MVTQRTEGLYRLFLFCQIVIVAALFWFGVWIMVTFYSPSAELTWRRYSIYCGLLVLGMLLESFTRSGSNNYFLQNELLRQHRLSFRQTFATAGLSLFFSSPQRTRSFCAFSFSTLFRGSTSRCSSRIFTCLRSWPAEFSVARKKLCSSVPRAKPHNCAAGSAARPMSDCARLD